MWPYVILLDHLLTSVIKYPLQTLMLMLNTDAETGFPRSHQLKSYVASKSRLKLAACCPVSGCWPSCFHNRAGQPKPFFCQLSKGY